MTRSTSNSKPPRPTRLSKRELMSAIVHRALWKHRDEISEPRDVLELRELAGHPGEVLMVGVADLIADGKVHGNAGRGRMVIEEPSA